MMKRCNALVICIIIVMMSVPLEVTAQFKSDSTHYFRWQQIIVPAAMIGIGTIPLYCSKANDLDTKLQQSMAGSRPAHIDDYMQYAPVVTVYGLNLAGIKGQHNFCDRTILLATSYMIMGISVNVLKTSVGRLRPNGLSHTSFPSGHTATAFMGAEFLYLEYRDTAPWIGYLGYAVATGVALLRVYNNAHYLSDVLAGAGIGILSTRIAYWVYPPLQRLLFGHKDNHTYALAAAPYYDPEYSAICMGCSMWF